MAKRRPSIYEFAGGADAFLALAAATHERCLQDPELNHPFSQTSDPNHLEHLAAYWAEVFGGPARYSESLGGQSAMLTVHAGHGSAPDFPPGAKVSDGLPLPKWSWNGLVTAKPKKALSR